MIFACVFGGFLAGAKEAHAVTRTIEQQINIIDQTYTNGSAVYNPTDNSLGLIRWDSAKYNGDTVYFEAVLESDPGPTGECSNTYAAFFASNGTQVSGSEVSEGGLGYTRVRSAALTLGTLPNLESGIDYTVRVRCSDIWGTSAHIRAARLIVVQSADPSITDTQTQIEVGNNQSTAGTTYADLTDKKIYRYTSANWDSAPTVNFEASLKASTGEGTPTDTGPNNPATGAQDTTVGAIVWGSYTNSFSDNATYDSLDLDKGEISYYNKATNFSFSGIPADATIKGIKVEVNGYVSNTFMDDYSVKIVKGGTVAGTDQASATDWPTTDDGTYRSYGGATSLWGTTWLPSDINANSGFGVAFAFINNKTGLSVIYTAFIDHIRITVTYAPAVASTAYAALYTTGGTLVDGSEVSLSSVVWTRVRTASPITLADATDYVLRIKASSGGTASIANAKIILDQTAAGGIDAIETVQQYNNTAATQSGTTYTSKDYDNSFNKSNFAGGTFAAYFETTIKTGIFDGATYYAQLDQTLGEQTGADTSYTRKISADLWSSLPASATDIDVQIKNTGPALTYSATSRLIIKVSGLAPAGGGGGDATLTQRAYVFQNDSGNTPDTNTNRNTGIAYPVQKGERFAVRFQVDNTGDGATTTQFHVQYDHNDGVWKSVTSGEIALSLGISGSNGDALTAETSQCVAGSSFVNGKWHENTATSLGVVLNTSECTELAFIFSTATAVPRTTYRFRLVTATSYVPFASVATPSIVLVTFSERKHSKTGAGAELAAVPTVSDDLSYYLDDTGYAAVAANDGVYDTATSSGSNVPVSLFKFRNPYANATESFTVHWDGQSNVAPSTPRAVFLEIWNNDSNAWLELASNNSADANTDFSFDTVTSGSALFDASFFTYVRVRQAAGAEALRTDFISLTWRLSGPGVDRQDIISDSRPGVGANHTISFAINSGFDASELLELDWPSDFAFPSDLDCGDADVATGTQFYLATTSTDCLATATNWGAIFISDTRIFRLTAPSDPGTYIATGTIMTFTIGLNASAQQTGTTQIVNPSTVGTYTLDVGGPVGMGRMLVAIIEGQTVEVTIAESLTVTVTGIAGASCSADDGASVTPVDATDTAIPFGNISPNTFYIACQDVAIATNAGGGYSATCQEESPLKTSGGTIIPDTVCDAGGCTESAGASWTNASNNGFGHTCRNQVNNDCASAYSNGVSFRQFANISGGEAAQAFMASSTTASATGRVKFRLSRGSTQAAGAYRTVVTYIITPTY
ncbi:MAG: hypothetical protein Q7S09_01665 [bacterium]|nr:hypothetical protein [bacterium]